MVEEIGTTVAHPPHLRHKGVDRNRCSVPDTSAGDKCYAEHRWRLDIARIAPRSALLQQVLDQAYFERLDVERVTPCLEHPGSVFIS
jgi:hypothetical protein